MVGLLEVDRGLHVVEMRLLVDRGGRLEGGEADLAAVGLLARDVGEGEEAVEVPGGAGGVEEEMPRAADGGGDFLAQKVDDGELARRRRLLVIVDGLLKTRDGELDVLLSARAFVQFAILEAEFLQRGLRGQFRGNFDEEQILPDVDVADVLRAELVAEFAERLVENVGAVVDGVLRGIERGALAGSGEKKTAVLLDALAGKFLENFVHGLADQSDVVEELLKEFGLGLHLRARADEILQRLARRALEAEEHFESLEDVVNVVEIFWVMNKRFGESDASIF